MKDKLYKRIGSTNVPIPAVQTLEDQTPINPGHILNEVEQLLEYPEEN